MGVGYSKSEVRAALYRGAIDDWNARCRRSARPVPYGLPAFMTPMARESACAVLAPKADFPRGVARSARSFFGRAGDEESVRALTPPDKKWTLDESRNRDRCPCCRAYQPEGNKCPSGWQVSHRTKTLSNPQGTLIDFNAETQVTSVISTLKLSNLKATFHGGEARALVRALAKSIDPRTWSHTAPESFKLSQAIDIQGIKVGEKRHGPPGEEPMTVSEGSWDGRLLELFQTSWNPESSTEVENILNISLLLGTDRLFLSYSLEESLSSKMWIARQAGGMDIDRGSCQVKIDGEKDVYIRAEKIVRFTQPKGAPSWLGTLTNYLAPAMLGIWLSRVVHGGAQLAIDALGGADQPIPPSPVPPGFWPGRNDKLRRS